MPSQNPAVETVGQHACCGGSLRVLKHQSEVLGVPATFSIFLPKEALAGQKVPVIHVLAGLTANHETFLIKSNAIRFAADHGIALVAPDTSPRDTGTSGEDDAYDLGSGAGFYVDATAEPWSRHYRMESYIRHELPALTETLFSLDGQRRGIMGHSMGGMGALNQALQYPEFWKTVSAFAPICHPSIIPWGQKAFDSYFGGDPSKWRQCDPTLLLRNGHKHPSTILVDQGLQDQYLSDLRADALVEAAKESGQALEMRHQDAYDHSYWFIQTFIADHLIHHAKGLKA
ncbi:S-formylglutathione hydrolase [Gluconobacter japonicus]|uniref:S-formylglutathione hydrolase n=1 Tax=Gluconobacter japonicus TaxID=376620 RepID=UPI0024AE73EE|nr:S-formylglutathione hydrolase [Gluconobacter japonicus]MDI6651906.1 S-formylglutathione hydrolase [Gluconobacter japonicus]